MGSLSCHESQSGSVTGWPLPQCLYTLIPAHVISRTDYRLKVLWLSWCPNSSTQGFSTSSSFNPPPGHSVLAYGIAVTYLCLYVKLAQTADAHRHRMGALRAELLGPECLCNLKLFCYLQLWPEACYSFVKIPAGLLCVCIGPRPQALWEHSSSG